MNFVVSTLADHLLLALTNIFHFLGNELLHKITTSEPHELRVDMEDFEGHSAYAEYTEFSIAGADDFYRLLCEGYSGTAGRDAQQKMTH